MRCGDEPFDPPERYRRLGVGNKSESNWASPLTGDYRQAAKFIVRLERLGASRP